MYQKKKKKRISCGHDQENPHHIFKSHGYNYVCMCVSICMYVCLMNGFISLPQLHEVFPLILKMQGKACMYNQNKKGMIFYVTIVE